MSLISSCEKAKVRKGFWRGWFMIFVGRGSSEWGFEVTQLALLLTTNLRWMGWDNSAMNKMRLRGWGFKKAVIDIFFRFSLFL